jgi:DNA-binding NarL/FixJ family response regulator
MENICAHHPHTGIILLMTSVSNDESRSLRKFLQRCKSGVAIYLKQSLDNPEQLYGIITSVSRGQVVLDPAVAISMLIDKTEAPFMGQLTDRELEILNLLSQGYTNQGIAGTLFIDIKTVEHHLNSIYGKLKEANNFNQKHQRVSVARLYLETTGELVPFNPKTSISLFPAP